MDNVGEIRLMKDIISYLSHTTYTASNDDISAIFNIG